jgi:hypothetical protein
VATESREAPSARMAYAYARTACATHPHAAAAQAQNPQKHLQTYKEPIMGPRRWIALLSLLAAATIAGLPVADAQSGDCPASHRPARPTHVRTTQTCALVPH